MRKHGTFIGWPMRDSKRLRFSMPNEIWDQKLRPIEFTIFSYLCYHQSYNPPAQITLQIIANSVHSTEITVKKYIESLIDKELIIDGWLLAPSLQCNSCKNFFTLPNEIFLLKLPPSAFMVYAYLLLIEDRKTNTCHPSYNTIAAETGLSKNTALKSINVLLEVGLITVKPSKGLSVKTVRNINQMISSACSCAVEQRIIAMNPTKGCALPKLEKKEMKILPLDCLNTFFEEAKRSGVFELYYIDLSTGLRRGELLGLKWSDIDLNKGVIRVQRQILRQNGAVVEAPLKTKNSYRNIAIGTDTVELIRQMKQRSTSEYVFPSPTGGPISPDSVLHKLQRVLKRAGLEKIPFHALRHTFSVLALQNGVDVKTLSAMLGHYSAGFTLDTYAHVTTAMQTKAANTVSSFLSGAIQ